MRLIAGGAPRPLERLRRSERDLEDIVKRWRRPDKVTQQNVQLAENFVSNIYNTMEDELPSFPPMWDAYARARSYVRSRHDGAMDAIAWFKRVLRANPVESSGGLRQVQDDAGALVETRRHMIVAVREFHEVVKPIIDTLEHIAKSSPPGMR